VIDHLRKAQGTEDFNIVTPDRVRDSAAKIQFSRSVIALDTPEKNDRQKVRIHVMKLNLSRPPEPVGMRIVEPGIAEWEKPEWNASVQVPGPVSRLDEAATFLRHQLADGAKPKADIVTAAQIAGISSKTLDRAKKELRVVSRPRMTGGKQLWWWSLPDHQEPER
jgi:hypothetical protein